MWEISPAGCTEILMSGKDADGTFSLQAEGENRRIMGLDSPDLFPPFSLCCKTPKTVRSTTLTSLYRCPRFEDFSWSVSCCHLASLQCPCMYCCWVELFGKCVQTLLNIVVIVIERVGVSANPSLVDYFFNRGNSCHHTYLNHWANQRYRRQLRRLELG